MLRCAVGNVEMNSDVVGLAESNWEAAARAAIGGLNRTFRVGRWPWPDFDVRKTEASLIIDIPDVDRPGHVSDSGIRLRWLQHLTMGLPDELADAEAESESSMSGVELETDDVVTGYFLGSPLDEFIETVKEVVLACCFDRGLIHRHSGEYVALDASHEILVRTGVQASEPPGEPHFEESV
jgi:hypothetical protein